MRFTIQQLTFVVLQGIHQASGHYGFPYVVVDGVVSKKWEFTRPSTNFFPNMDYSGANAMCGPNATQALIPVKTLKLEAGSTIGFAASKMLNNHEHDDFRPFDPAFTIYHDGPATAYMSKAPGELNDYTGDGDWFKIAAIGASDGIHWDIDTFSDTNVMNFTIPASTPPGKYLLRGEHLNIFAMEGLTEMYINCVHVEITGSGQGTPGPVTKFPGAFDSKDPGIVVPEELWRPTEPKDGLINWEGAGPSVWRG